MNSNAERYSQAFKGWVAYRVNEYRRHASRGMIEDFKQVTRHGRSIPVADGRQGSRWARWLSESVDEYYLLIESTRINPKICDLLKKAILVCASLWSAQLCIIQSGNGFALVLADEVRPNIVARRA